MLTIFFLPVRNVRLDQNQSKNGPDTCWPISPRSFSTGVGTGSGQLRQVLSAVLLGNRFPTKRLLLPNRCMYGAKYPFGFVTTIRNFSNKSSIRFITKHSTLNGLSKFVLFVVNVLLPNRCMYGHEICRRNSRSNKAFEPTLKHIYRFFLNCSFR